MKDKDQLVSVIVPVYNAEKYIKRCLDSISLQSYSNLEIIVVDDGSQDKSASICEQCAYQDKRIIVIKNKNEGAGYARNTGMNKAQGKYIFFIDADDYILSNCIERLLDVAVSEKADIVKCGWIQGREENYHAYPKKQEFSIYDHVSVFRTRKMNISVNGKLYKREVIGENRYPKVTMYDDEFFTYKLIYNASKIIILDETYYYYYMSPCSIMRGKKNKQPLQFIEAYNERICFFEDQKEIELANISHKELAIRLMLAYIRRGRYVESDMQEKELLARFRKEYMIGKHQAAGAKEKVALFLFNMMPDITKIVLQGIV